MELVFGLVYLDIDMFINNVLIILFAVLDTSSWDINELSYWVDRLLSRLEHPKTWISDLAINNSVASCLDIIRGAMKESGISFPDNIGNLMVGLILLRFDRGELSAEAARTQLIDIIDAYGTTFLDAEKAVKLDLNHTIYSEIREIAKKTMRYLYSEELLETEKKLITYELEG